MKTIYKGDSRYEKIHEQMQLLGIQDVSTPRQVKNGTIVWRLPILSNARGRYMEYGSFASGYVRNQGVDCHSNWQINKRFMGDYEYYPDYEWVKDEHGEWSHQVKTGKFNRFRSKKCEIIPIEFDRLEYMMKYVIKNEFLKRSNAVQKGDFVPKWKYGRVCDRLREQKASSELEELTVIVDGTRYRII